jgi:hypothetical protein
MHQETVLVPGARRVEATLDAPDADTDGCVVAAPPHPQAGGHRGDRRLTAVSDVLLDHGVACLRVDYGDWDEGYGEREDVRNAFRWAAAEYAGVAAFGYSFGASMTLLAAASTDVDLAAVCALSPASTLPRDLDAADAVADIRGPLRVVAGTRDTVVDWEPIANAARAAGHDVVELPGDHHFVGQDAMIAETCGEWLAERLD